jgi:RimJ/RimL family protein N-acetyltransferase
MRELLPRIRSWAVLDKTDGALIGVVMFEPVGAMGGKSYVAARRRSWGKGLLEEAAHLGIREVFRNPEIGYIFGFVAGNNAPARAFNERIGMRLKNVLPDYVLQAGELHDMRIYEITRERWTH